MGEILLELGGSPATWAALATEKDPARNRERARPERNWTLVAICASAPRTLG